jgi:serine/threonine-protein kinase
MDPFIGTVVAGRYRVTDAIGKGGMGTVYRAVQENLDRSVALKVILPHHLTSPDAVARFEREARTIAKLNHENIITIHDFGSLPDGGLFIVMELLDGRPLTTLVTPTATMPWTRSLLLMRDVARALAVAHSHNIIHRDLKPDNIMVIGAGDHERAKVLDFGVAKLHGDPQSNTLTEAGIIIGTPAYMAPEVVLGDESANARADLFSLGLVWFEMLTGIRVFDAATPSATLVQVATRKIPSLRDVDMRSPAAVAAIVDGLLQKDPSLRTQSASILLAQIDHAIEQTASGQFEKPTRLGAIGAERAVRRTLNDDDDEPSSASGTPPSALTSPMTLPMGSLGAPGIKSTTAPSSMAPTSAATGPLETPATGGVLVPVAQRATGTRKTAAGVVVFGMVAVATIAAIVTMRTQPPASADAAYAPDMPASPIVATTATVPDPAPTTIAAGVAAGPGADGPKNNAGNVAGDVADRNDDDAPATATATAARPSQKAILQPKPQLQPKPKPKPLVEAKPVTAPVVVATAPAEPPPLNSDTVEAAIQKNLGKAAACRNTNITNARSGGGLLVDHCPSYKTLPTAQQLLITIAPNGTVTGARLRDGSTASTPLAACVLESLKDWQFPAFSGDAVEIGQRLSFKTCVPINGKCVFAR